MNKKNGVFISDILLIFSRLNLSRDYAISSSEFPLYEFEFRKKTIHSL